MEPRKAFFANTPPEMETEKPSAAEGFLGVNSQLSENQDTSVDEMGENLEGNPPNPDREAQISARLVKIQEYVHATGEQNPLTLKKVILQEGGLTPEEASELFDRLDLNQDGLLDPAEWDQGLQEQPAVSLPESSEFAAASGGEAEGSLAAEKQTSESGGATQKQAPSMLDVLDGLSEPALASEQRKWLLWRPSMTLAAVAMVSWLYDVMPSVQQAEIPQQPSTDPSNDEVAAESTNALSISDLTPMDSKSKSLL